MCLAEVIICLVCIVGSLGMWVMFGVASVVPFTPKVQVFAYDLAMLTCVAFGACCVVRGCWVVSKFVYVVVRNT